MAEYFFEIADENPPVPSGPIDLVDVAEARIYALRYAGELLSNQRTTFWANDEWKMTVTNENRLPLFTISITSADALAIEDAR